ncbi:MAG TPA: twin-arginine translocase TatA/TatE family subunit [Pirellulales bacterium]|nr:twin-arginine translocase TatA/TatE family subunit [Pirellulales bacterium]
MTPVFAFFGTHPMELAIIAGVVLLLFGNRLPALMRSMGRSVVEFKKGVNEVEHDESGDGAKNAPSGNS